MVVSRSVPASTRRSPTLVPRPDHWHRPLMLLAVLMAVLSVVTVILAVVDPRQLLGQNVWFKPLKFALSIGVYAVSLAWLIGQVRRLRRAANVFGTVTAVALVIEIVIIVGAAVAGTTSHFNVSTPLNTTLWVVMAASIAIVWIASFIVGIAVALNPGPDTARNVAVQAGVLLGLVGMGLAFLMTGPHEDQINNFQGIVGAHAVGVPDGGAGLPFLGWSTDGGDLRIPHFLGMHALQAIPLSLLVMEWLSIRVPVLRSQRVRLHLVVVAALAIAAALTILTWQALIGQSIIYPSGPVLTAAAVTVFGAIGASVIILVLARSTQHNVLAR